MSLSIIFNFSFSSSLYFLNISFSIFSISFLNSSVVYLPGDGFIVAMSKAFKKEFGKIKPYCDVSFVIIAASLSFIFFRISGGGS